MADDDPDVPSVANLQSRSGAAAWVATADTKRPQRIHIRNAIVNALQSLAPGSGVLELGSGPGFLAEQALRRCPNLVRYTLLDFSQPMLDMSRDRVGSFPAATFVLGDFRSEAWTKCVTAPYEAVVSMQAVHEVRHKRHVPRLYRQIYGILVSTGIFLVADRVPDDGSSRSAALFMTAEEQLEALTGAGFMDARILMSGDALILCRSAKRDESSVRSLALDGSWPELN